MRLLQCNKLRNRVNPVIIRIFRILLAAGICAGLLGCAGGTESLVLERSEVTEDVTDAQSVGENEEESISEEIVVFVCGAVLSEGVYRLPQGARLGDAVEAAGGFSGDADSSWLNLAAFARDGEKIRVPTEEEGLRLREKELQTESGSRQGMGPVNINTADSAELQRIPGIGEVRANRIIAYREENGVFTDPEEITRVSGIGEAVYREIKDYITVSD